MSKVLKKSQRPLTLLLAVTLTFLAACSKSGNTTPTASGPAAAATRAYFEAITRKDYAAAKRYLSAGSVRKL